MKNFWIRCISAVIVLVVAAILAFVVKRPALDNSVAAWLPQRSAQIRAFQNFKANFKNDEVILLRISNATAKQRYRFLELVGETFEIADSEADDDQSDETAEETTDETTEEASDEAEEQESAADATDQAAETVVTARARSITSALTVFPDAFDVLSEESLGGFSKQNWSAVNKYFGSPINKQLKLFDNTLDLGAATCYINVEAGEPESRTIIVKSVEQIKSQFKDTKVQFELAGQPFVNLFLDNASKAVEAKAMPLLVGLCVILVLLATRSITLTAAAFIPVALGVFASEGLLTTFGFSNNLIVTIVKPLLFVLILAGALHLVVYYQQIRESFSTSSEAILAVLKKKAAPCLTAYLTTAIGFGSLASADVKPIQDFGVVAAIGLVLACGLILILMPFVIELIGPRGRETNDGAFDTIPQWTIDKSQKLPIFIVVISVLLFCGGLACFSKLRVEPHAIRYFPKEHWLRSDYDKLESEGFGLASLELVFDNKADLWKKSPQRVEQLKAIDGFLNSLVTNKHVTGRLDPIIMLREAAYQSSSVDGIPANGVIEDIIEELDLLSSHFFNDSQSQFKATLFVKTIDADQIDEIKAQVNQLIKSTPALSKVKITPTGSYPLLLETQRSLLQTLKVSLGSTALLMLLVMFFVLRSVKLTLLSVLPNAFPVAINFLIMIAIDVPLDVGTTMTTAIALGIAVDDTIHFLSAWKKGGIEGAKKSTGKAILLSSLIIGAGFATLMTSDFIPTRYFGMLCMSAMFSALVGDLIILPAILHLFAQSESTAIESQATAQSES